MTYNVSNPRYTKTGDIDVLWDHPQLGLIPFTAGPNDPEAHGREIFAQVKDIAAPYVPVPEPVFFPTLTPRQFWMAAASIGITKDQVMAAIDRTLPAQQALVAKIELTETINFQRDHPSVTSLANLMGIPSEQLDTLCNWAATL